MKREKRKEEVPRKKNWADGEEIEAATKTAIWIARCLEGIINVLAGPRGRVEWV